MLRPTCQRCSVNSIHRMIDSSTVAAAQVQTIVIIPESMPRSSCQRKTPAGFHPPGVHVSNIGHETGGDPVRPSR